MGLRQSSPANSEQNSRINEQLNSSNLSSSIIDEEEQFKKKKRKFICCCSEEEIEVQPYIERYQKWKRKSFRLLSKKFQEFDWSHRMIKIFNQNTEQAAALQEQNRMELIALTKNQSDLRYSVDDFNIQFKKQQNQNSEILEESKERIIQHEDLKQSKDQYVRVVQINLDQKIQFGSIPNKYESIIEEKKLYQKEEKRQYKRVMQLIQKQFTNDKFHPLWQFICIYLQYFDEFDFKKKYEKEGFFNQMRLIKKNYNQKYKLNQHISMKMMDDVKYFIDFFTQSLLEYYDLINSIQSYITYFTKDNISSFVMNNLFNDRTLFSKIFDSISTTNEEESQLFYNNIIKFKNQKPDFFGVSQHFELLNENLLLYQMNQNCKENLDPEQSVPDITFDSEMFNKHNTKSNSTFASNDNNYILPIKQLKLLQKVQSPVHQLKIICSITELIQFSIIEFYKNNNLKMQQKLAAEDLIPITIYIIIQSGIKDLGSYLKMIENFTPRNAMNSSAGYKLVTMQNCYQIIQNLSESNRSSVYSNRQQQQQQQQQQTKSDFYEIENQLYRGSKDFQILRNSKDTQILNVSKERRIKSEIY